MLNITSLIPKFVSNLPLYGVIGLTAMTTGVASMKILNNNFSVSAQESGVAQVRVQKPEEREQNKHISTDNSIYDNEDKLNDESQDATEHSDGVKDVDSNHEQNEVEQNEVEGNKVKPTITVTSTPVLGVVFTMTSLALHNTTDDCYVGYDGVVYDVSNNASWADCNHHGITGGIDITSRFPHSTSYFNTLPKVGSLTGGQTNSGGQSGDDMDDQGEIEGQDNDFDDDNSQIEVLRRDSTYQNTDRTVRSEQSSNKRDN